MVNRRSEDYSFFENDKKKASASIKKQKFFASSDNA